MMRLLEDVVQEVLHACPVEGVVMPFRFYAAQVLPPVPEYSGLLGVLYACRGCGTTALYYAKEQMVVDVVRAYVLIPELEGQE